MNWNLWLLVVGSYWLGVGVERMLPTPGPIPWWVYLVGGLGMIALAVYNGKNKATR